MSVLALVLSIGLAAPLAQACPGGKCPKGKKACKYHGKDKKKGDCKDGEAKDSEAKDKKADG